MLSRSLYRLTRAWIARWPLARFDTWGQFFGSISSPVELLDLLKADMNEMWVVLVQNPTRLSSYYDYTQAISSIDRIKAPFNTTDWQDEAAAILSDLWDGVELAIFHEFGVEPHIPTGQSWTIKEQAESMEGVLGTVYFYFCIAAGSLLIVLAIMGFFAKKDRTRAMWVSIGIKASVGIGVMFPIMASLMMDLGGMFSFAPWGVAIVTLGYFAGKHTLESGSGQKPY